MDVEVNPDRNRSYDLAAEYAGESDLIVLRSAEVTRSMPPDGMATLTDFHRGAIKSNCRLEGEFVLDVQADKDSLPSQRRVQLC